MAIGQVEVNVVPLINAAAFQAAVQNAVKGISVNVNVNATGATAGIKGISNAAASAQAQLGSMRSAALNALQVIGGSAIAKKAANFFKTIITDAGNLGETMNVVAVQFGAAQSQVEEFARTATTTFGLANKQAFGFASRFSVLGRAINLSGSELATFSTKLSGLVGDLSSFFNKDLESSAVQVIAALRGEYEPIRNLGVLLDENTINLAGQAAGLKKIGKDYTQAQKVQLRYNEILKQTAQVTGDYARTLGISLPNQIRTLKAEFANLTTDLGQRFLPIALTAIKGVRSLVHAFASLPPGVQAAIVSISAAAAGLLGVTVALAGFITLTKPLKEAFNDFGGFKSVATGLRSAASSIVGSISKIVAAQTAAAASGAATGGLATGVNVGAAFARTAPGLAGLTATVPPLAIAAAAVAAAFALWKLDPDLRAAVKDIYDSLARIPATLALAISKVKEFASELSDTLSQVPVLREAARALEKIGGGLLSIGKGLIDTPFQAIAAGLDFATGKGSEGLNNLKKSAQGFINVASGGLTSQISFTKNLFGIKKPAEDSSKAIEELIKTARDLESANSELALAKLVAELNRLDASGKSASEEAVKLNQQIFEIKEAAKAAKKPVDSLTAAIDRIADTRAGVKEGAEAIRAYAKALDEVQSSSEAIVSAEADALFGSSEDDLAKRKRANDDIVAIRDVARANEDAKDRTRQALEGIDASYVKSADARRALKAAEKALKKARTTDLEDLELAEKAANRAIEDSIIQLAAARETERLSAQGVDDAYRRLEELKDQVPRTNRALARSETGITDALRNQARAIRDRVLAENAYSDAIEARRRAVQDIKRADFAVTDALVAQQRALEDQRFAVEDARKVLDGYTTSSKEAAKALLDLRDAQLAAEGGAISIGEARDKFLAASAAARAGTGSSRDAQAARLALDQARQAARQQALASESLTATGAVPTERERVTALRTIADSAKVARDAAQSVEQARRGQADSLKAVRDATLGITAAQDGLVDADLRIRDSGRSVVDAYDARSDAAKAVRDLERDIARQQTDVIPAAILTHIASVRAIETAQIEYEASVRSAEKAHQAVIDQTDVILEKDAAVAKSRMDVKEAVQGEKDAIKELKRAREDEVEAAKTGQDELDSISLRQQKNTFLENNGFDLQNERLRDLKNAFEAYAQAKREALTAKGLAELTSSDQFISAPEDVKKAQREALEAGQSAGEIRLRAILEKQEKDLETLKKEEAILQEKFKQRPQIDPRTGNTVLPGLPAGLNSAEKAVVKTGQLQVLAIAAEIKKLEAEQTGTQRALAEATKSAGSGIGKAIADGTGDALREELVRVLGDASNVVKVKVGFDIVDTNGQTVTATDFQKAVQTLFASGKSAASKIRGSFDGGPAYAGVPMIVGESHRGGKGELFIPGQSGQIISNERLVGALREALAGGIRTGTTVGSINITTRATQREPWFAEVGNLIGGRRN